MSKELYRLIWIPDNAMYLYFNFLFRDITQNVPEYGLEKTGILAYFCVCVMSQNKKWKYKYIACIWHIYEVQIFLICDVCF